MFRFMTGKESCCGFSWGYLESVCREPVVKCVKVGLEYLGCSVWVWMCACESDVICVGGRAYLGCGGCGYVM